MNVKNVGEIHGFLSFVLKMIHIFLKIVNQ